MTKPKPDDLKTMLLVFLDRAAKDKECECGWSSNPYPAGNAFYRLGEMAVSRHEPACFLARLRRAVEASEVTP